MSSYPGSTFSTSRVDRAGLSVPEQSRLRSKRGRSYCCPRRQHVMTRRDSTGFSPPSADSLLHTLLRACGHLGCAQMEPPRRSCSCDFWPLGLLGPPDPLRQVPSGSRRPHVPGLSSAGVRVWGHCSCLSRVPPRILHRDEARVKPKQSWPLILSGAEWGLLGSALGESGRWEPAR